MPTLDLLYTLPEKAVGILRFAFLSEDLFDRIKCWALIVHQSQGFTGFDY